MSIHIPRAVRTKPSSRFGEASRRRFIGGLLIGASALCCGVASYAQTGASANFGNRPVRLLVGYSPGGAADLTARVYAQKLQDVLGVPVVVENKPGAFEQLAAQPTISAPADGHTLWLGTSGALTMGPGVRPSTPYDILKNFTPVAKIGEVNAVITVGMRVPINNFAELVAYAKANPYKLNYASAGVGAGSHLLMEYIMELTRTSMTHVPYKGDADVARELAAGNADVGILTISTAAPFIKDARIKGIAATGSQRSPTLPRVPLLMEENVVEPLKNYGVYSIYGVMGPAGLPPAVTRTLNDAFTKVSRMPEVIQQLEQANVHATSSTPEELRQFIERDVARWREVGRKIKVD